MLKGSDPPTRRPFPFSDPAPGVKRGPPANRLPSSGTGRQNKVEGNELENAPNGPESWSVFMVTGAEVQRWEAANARRPLAPFIRRQRRAPVHVSAF